ncbi:MAG: bifunctional glutamate N-acetyltransferase/amino-acid acetyltransferase ArgJ [Candidatus Tectomicrobia bacterium]|nr:bifunctional glutamate N-acetyltransferase/amino-acid acetyltransferase ArgJ [Candidatus Tectomicrobia bacterium]
MARLVGGGWALVRGMRTAGVACGVKKQGLDLALLVSDRPASVAAMFTRNRVAAAPVVVSREVARTGRARAIIANSGNANACTGERGLRDAREMACLAAAALRLEAREVLVASTGVIGAFLPMERLRSGIPEAGRALGAGDSRAAAQAIMTTDTFAKETAVEIILDGCPVTIGGIAKGAGMIHPDMATMLAFLATDADVAAEPLQQALRAAVEDSFHAITIDGDTSTNDSVVCLANGAAGLPPLQPGSEGYAAFAAALRECCVQLAQQIVRDGEGATKFVTLRVVGAASDAEARIAGRAVACSTLVKTALFGGDPNWGRIIAALGVAPIQFEPQRVSIYLGDHCIAANGCALESDWEPPAAALLKKRDVHLRIDLGLGRGEATVWTSDLSEEYVRINAAYRS